MTPWRLVFRRSYWRPAVCEEGGLSVGRLGRRRCRPETGDGNKAGDWI